MNNTWKPKTAGILAIIAGATGIAIGSMVAALATSLRGCPGVGLSNLIDKWSGICGPGMWGAGREFLPGILEQIPGEILGQILGFASTALIAIAVVAIVFGIIALIGGINAIKRRRWGLALAGAILATPIMPPLGVLSIIFVSMGKREFC